MGKKAISLFVSKHFPPPLGILESRSPPLPVFSLVYIFRSSFKAKPKPGPLGLEPDLLLLAAIFFLLLLDFGFRQQNGLAAGKNIGNLQGEFLGQVDQAPLLPVFSYHLDYRS